MSTFRLYLWKEWREQRPAVLALAGMLPMLVLAITFGMKARQVGVPYFAAASGLVALVVTLLAIGGEILGSDRRAGGGQWLERLPAGLSGAFPAKLALFASTSVLALTYGFVLAQLGAFLRGRAADSALELVQRDPLLALGVLGAAAVLASWTFAASAWAGRGMLALLGGCLVLAGITLVARHFVQLEYTPPALEVVLVALALVAAGLTSAWVGFVRGRRFGRGLLATAARGLPAGALCVLPVAGWSLHQLRDRQSFDLRSTDCRVHGAWISGDGHTALLWASRESERWLELPSRVIRIDLRRGTHEVLCGPGADFEGHWTELGSVPSQEVDLIRIFNESSMEAGLVLDAFSAEVQSDIPEETMKSEWYAMPAGHGFSVSGPGSDIPSLIDPYHGLHMDARDIGFDWWNDVYIGPAGWLIESWPYWLEYSPDRCELVPAAWIDPTIEAGPMLADGRLLVRLPVDEVFALVDPEAQSIVPVSRVGLTSRHPAFLQQGGLHPGELALVDTEGGRYRLDEEVLELVPCDDSYAGQLVRWLSDGTLFFLMDDGLYRRAPDGARTCAFSFAGTEVAP